MIKRILTLQTWALALGLSFVACGDCAEEIDEARVFLEQHRSCQIDADCVAVSTGCHTFANGLCAQAPVNRSAAATTQWQRLRRALERCERECDICTAALVPQCTGGFCGGPR